MNGSPRKRRHFVRAVLPLDPAITPFDNWLPANRSFFGCFRKWLFESGYSISAMKIYGVGVRQALGFLNKPYWQIDPEADLERAWQFINNRPIAASTRQDYHKGLEKLAEYLRLRCHKPPLEKEIHWQHYLGVLPAWLQEDIHHFIAHCQRSWPLARRHKATIALLSPLTLFLRWAAEQMPFDSLSELNPERWFAYLDKRLAAGISPKALNRELAGLRHLLYYLQEHDRPVCERTLLVDYLDDGYNLPRDLPPEQLRLLLQAILADCASSHRGVRRTGLLDQAWFQLMLHSGLRAGEIRSLRLSDIDWERRWLRIEQSKGLKDRLVPFSQAAAEALSAYLTVRGPAEALPEEVFIYRHQPLSTSYCYERLGTYGRRCGVSATPHQLRHSCATLLLNAGAPILTVQAILGHKEIDTTLGYARLYDGTVAADYYQAMSRVEKRLAMPEDRLAAPPSTGQLLALVDALSRGALNPNQMEAVRALQSGLLALSELEKAVQDVKVPASAD
jgi:site-specific recombinase XerD